MSIVRVKLWNIETFEKITLEKKTKRKLPSRGWRRLYVEIDGKGGMKN
ncbi:hypothetical protein LCGC14_0846630 [marine sediment metagenome]|uniref:Uncharacterized protein n=1 Tax=marine sediment metagenome TaxID=412755 RepID=A0A0F9PBH9_9ZZZZ